MNPFANTTLIGGAPAAWLLGWLAFQIVALSAALYFMGG